MLKRKWCEQCGQEITLFNTYGNNHGEEAKYTHTETPPWPHIPEVQDTDETEE